MNCLNYRIRNSIINLLRTTIHDIRVLVVGDVMLDRYFSGEVSRISPEAPVPINVVTSVREKLGGAANVVHNLALIGCKADICGLVGCDYNRDLLQGLLNEIHIGVDGLIENRKYTTTKIRILGGHQQMMRLDFEEKGEIDNECEKMLVEYCKKRMKNVDAVIISDYGKGVCSKFVCQEIIKAAHMSDSLVFVDPKGDEWDKYRGADFITPNVKEISDSIGHKVLNQNDMLEEAAKQLKKDYEISNIVITRSEKGISLYAKDKIRHFPTVARDVFDVSGAGDTVISVFAAAVSSGMNLFASSYLANFAAGIEVGKVGTYAVSADDILDVL